jgi:hypothetical protein
MSQTSQKATSAIVTTRMQPRNHAKCPPFAELHPPLTFARRISNQPESPHRPRAYGVCETEVSTRDHGSCQIAQPAKSSRGGSVAASSAWRTTSGRLGRNIGRFYKPAEISRDAQSGRGSNARIEVAASRIW